MKEFIIVGCGLAGITTALELLRRGHRVTLFDAAKSEGLGASYANGGMLTPSMSDPWNAPGVYRHMLASLVDPHAALKLNLAALPSLLSWGPRFLLNSGRGRFVAATNANFDLACYSLPVLASLMREFDLSFDESSRGTMKLFRTQQALDASMAASAALRARGLIAEPLDPAGAVSVEPCLAPIRASFAGAIYYPRDGSGDAHKFCASAAAVVRQLGGVFRFGAPVSEIVIEGGAAAGVRCGQNIVRAANVVIATGVDSPKLAATAGIRLHVKPVKGYSITYDLDPSLRGPRIPVVDDALHAAVTPLGRRLRVAGTAELAGQDLRLDQRRLDNIARMARTLFPDIFGSEMLAGGRPWTGLRPVAADGRPYVGRAKEGLWINAGHGHLGWTLAAGSARLLADLAEGRRPEIDPAPFAVGR